MTEKKIIETLAIKLELDTSEFDRKVAAIKAAFSPGSQPIMSEHRRADDSMTYVEIVKATHEWAAQALNSRVYGGPPMPFPSALLNALSTLAEE